MANPEATIAAHADHWRRAEARVLPIREIAVIPIRLVLVHVEDHSRRGDRFGYLLD